jgi:hypothetical protein
MSEGEGRGEGLTKAAAATSNPGVAVHAHCGNWHKADNSEQLPNKSSQALAGHSVHNFTANHKAYL